jgi:hypothetical protein
VKCRAEKSFAALHLRKIRNVLSIQPECGPQLV